MDSDFYKELTLKSQILPDPNTNIPEDDISLTEDDFEDSAIQDDSNIPLKVLVSSLVSGAEPDNDFVDTNMGFRSQADAKSLNKESEETGRGKRKRRQNTLYASENFWRHYNKDKAEVEEME